MSFKIQLRRDTAANWASANPVLIDGEFGYETDTRKAKIGDNTLAYVDLPYWPDTNSINLYGPTGSFQVGATGIGITGDLVTTETIGTTPFYRISGATTRMYCIRFEYDSSDDLTGTTTILSGGPWTSTGLTISTANSPQTATFKFANEPTPPKNIYGYFYKAGIDIYTLSTFGLGGNDYVTTATLNSNTASPTVTNDFFTNFSDGVNEIELNMLASTYGGASNLSNNIHAYVILLF